MIRVLVGAQIQQAPETFDVVVDLFELVHDSCVGD